MKNTELTDGLAAAIKHLLNTAKESYPQLSWMEALTALEKVRFDLTEIVVRNSGARRDAEWLQTLKSGDSSDRSSGKFENRQDDSGEGSSEPA